MIRRRHQSGEIISEAVYSDCGAYRYLLAREWQTDGPALLMVMLNPSTATEEKNDPTIERCQRRARRMGFGALRIVNLFAFRATDPKVMKAASDPVGPENDPILRAEATSGPGMILCAWGTHGAHLGRGKAVARLLRDCGAPLWHLGMTVGGHPKHPLYLGNDLAPHLWS